MTGPVDSNLVCGECGATAGCFIEHATNQINSCDLLYICCLTVLSLPGAARMKFAAPSTPFARASTLPFPARVVQARDCHGRRQCRRAQSAADVQPTADERQIIGPLKKAVNLLTTMDELVPSDASYNPALMMWCVNFYTSVNDP